MDLLILGVNGLLGSNLAAEARDRGMGVSGTYHSSAPDLDLPVQRLDIRNDDRFTSIVADLDPDIVINCAAMTEVDACESDPALAYEVNASAPRQIAAICEGLAIRFVHVSTDYVFDGTSTGAYHESSTVNPIQVYGKSKLDGEQGVIDVHDSPMLIRLSFLYGIHRSTGCLAGFPAWVRDRLSTGASVPLFTDQTVTPTRANQAADVILALLDLGRFDTYHVACRSCLTPFAFGEEICRRIGAPVELLEQTRLSERELEAPRPKNTCLDVSKVEDTLDHRQPTLSEDLGTIGERLDPI